MIKIKYYTTMKTKMHLFLDVNFILKIQMIVMIHQKLRKIIIIYVDISQKYIKETFISIILQKMLVVILQKKRKKLIIKIKIKIIKRIIHSCHFQTFLSKKMFKNMSIQNCLIIITNQKQMTTVLISIRIIIQQMRNQLITIRILHIQNTTKI